MSRLFLSALLLVIVVTLASYTIVHFKHAEVKGAGGNGFAVVELFTSEGCSSCPPADAALAQLLNTGKRNVYVLGFHVDYWNSLGWKDVYSNALYSNRQQGYSNILKLSSVYTPQAIVNGKTEFTASDTKRLNDVVEEALGQSAPATIEISAKNEGTRIVNVSYKLNSAKHGGVINIALVQLHAQSNVKRGENSGRVLSHVNVVRNFKTVNATEGPGNVTIEMPDGLTATDCKIIAFTQDEGWQITSATEAAIQ